MGAISRVFERFTITEISRWQSARVTSFVFCFDFFISHTQRVVRFILRAIRDFIVERTEAFCPVTVCGSAHVARWKPEDPCERMKNLCHAASVRRKAGKRKQKSASIGGRKANPETLKS